MRNLLVFLIGTVFIIYGCRVPKRIRENFTTCFCDTFNPDPERKINKYGYYYRLSDRPSIADSILQSNTIYGVQFPIRSQNFLFYPNGLIRIHSGWLKPPNEIIRQYWFDKFNREENKYWGYNYWGIYQVRNDTIIYSFIERGNLNNSWSMDRAIELIIDSMTLKDLGMDLRIVGNNFIVSEMIKSPQNMQPYQFAPLTYYPPSNSWLLVQKWFWCKGTFPGRRTIRKRLKNGYYDHPYNTVKPAKRR